MKKKNLYTMCTAAAVCVVYTLTAFNHPTDKEQEQSVFTNALLLVDNSFRNIDRDTNDSSFVINTLSTSPAAIPTQTALPQTSIIEDVKKYAVTTSDQEKTDNEIVTIASIPEDTKNGSSKVTVPKKKSKTSNKKKKKEKESVTILSISNSSCKDEKIAISIADTYVNIRKKADTDSKILGKLYKNNAAHILKQKGEWLYIESGNVKGYVKAEYIKSGLSEKELADYGTVTATVQTDGLNVREKASTESKRIDLIYMGEKYPVLKKKGEWVKLDLKDDDLKGYVKAEFITISMSFSEAISIEEENALKKVEESRKADQQTASSEPASSSKLTKTTGKSTSHSTDELTLLACLVHAEAGNQSYEGKLAVANVVLNRVRSGKYPNIINKVVYQRGQFSVASSGSLSKQLNHYSHFKTSSQKLSIQAAKDALAGINNIGNRLYFNRYSKHVANKHSRGGVKIDDQFFW